MSAEAALKELVEALRTSNPDERDSALSFWKWNMGAPSHWDVSTRRLYDALRAAEREVGE